MQQDQQGTKRQMDADDAANAISAQPKRHADADCTMPVWTAKARVPSASQVCVPIMRGTTTPLPYNVYEQYMACHLETTDVQAVYESLSTVPPMRALIPQTLFDADGNGPDTLVYSIDFEGTGADHTRHYPNEIGAVAFAFTHVPGNLLRQWCAVSCFSASLAPPSPSHGFDPERKVQFWDLPENAAHLRRLQETAVHPSVVMPLFFDWLDSFKAQRYVQLSDLPQYDAAWLDHLHAQYTAKKGPMFLRYPKMHLAKCTDSLMGAVLGDALAKWVSTEEACKAAGAAYFKPAREHEAVHDAYAIGVNYLRIAAAKAWLGACQPLVPFVETGNDMPLQKLE